MIDYVINFIAQALGMSGEHFTIILVGIVLFILLFIDFGIIINNFTAFSPWVAWVIAFLLCAAASVTGIINLIALFFTGIFGYLGATLVLILLKVGASILELLISKKLKKDKEKRKEFERKQGKKLFETVGRQITKK